MEQFIENDEKKVGDFGILPARELKTIVEEFNDTAVDYSRDKCVHELFREQAKRVPEKTALIFQDKRFTYRELDAMSDSLAHFLQEKGVQKGDRVAVLLNRDERVVMAQLAVLKLGAVFIPVDSRYPQERIEYILTESKAKVLLKNKDNDMRFAQECCIEDWDMMPAGKLEAVQVSSDAASYIIFTSGSTGQPKGCVLTNKGLVNFCKNLNVLEKCEQLNEPVCIAVNTISFDMFITESLLPLINGYTIVLASEEESLNQELFAKLVEKHHTNIIQTTPTRYKIYFSGQGDLSFAKYLKVIVSSGEALPLELLQSFVENTDAAIYNPLGPSECTVYSVGSELKFLERKDAGKKITGRYITIGRPIANTQIYILGSDGNPLPIGVAGELCIAGDGVGLGYLNRPELTAERFVGNPFATEENGHGKIMYRTGDLARWRADGEIEYLGRIDTQVKIRGLRIELGEIENVMSGFPGIGLCAVADKKDEAGRQYLVGYYTATDTGDNAGEKTGGTVREIDEKALRQHLSAKLPRYMIPNYFLHLDAMPMTPSGKTDRKNLPVPDFNVQDEEYIAPETDTEIKLAGIWKKLLKLPKVGRTDDFFELGGDSLLAISMLSEIEAEFSVEISMKDVMGRSVLERLALCIEQCVKQTGSTVNRVMPCHKDRFVLLPQQKAIYAACRKAPEALLYNMPARIALPETIDRSRLKKAICRTVSHHKILRMHILTEVGEIYGICDGDVEFSFEEYGTENEKEFVRPFALEKAPLFRVGFTEDALLFDIHHIIADGETLNIILGDIVKVYEGEELSEEKLWYGDYAEYFLKCDFAEHRNYFREMLKCDFEKMELPLTKNGRPGGESMSYRIPEETVTAARKYAAENGLTDTMVFLGAYGILLSKYTARKDVLSSVILRNRNHIDLADMAGMFVNTLPMHFEVAGSTEAYFTKIKKIVLDLYQYQELPFWEIADAVGMSDKTVVNTSFVYQADGEKRLVLDGESLLPEFLDTRTAKFDFSMEITPLRQDCRMRLEYDCGKYDRVLMDELAAAYIRILEQLTKESIAGISVLSDEMYHRVTEEFNDTAVDYPRDKCVHELFREQVEREPEGIALVFQEKRFTYLELDEMSNSLAHFLRERGVGRGDVVPILARRSWHIVVAMLGILKAGAAYMPVSPDYPEDRIAYILATARSRVVLSFGYDGSLSAECIKLEEFDFQYDTCPVGNANAPEDLCYVIFTSGSTGTPKGVSISHRNVVNYCDNNNNNVCSRIIKDGYRSIVSVTNIVFDIFVTETLLPLLNGIAIYFADDEEAMRQDRLAELVSQNGIEIMQTTPTRMRSYMLDRANTGYLRSFKTIILGGEAFPADLYAELQKYTKANIFNIYGPAETTVWSSNAEIVTDGGAEAGAADITIGRPIANTQIYILGSDGNPLPIGAAGELCIAGDGVGLGYLNRPELTAERFVENPFATEENGHGKIMYRTGDLARWRADGEIEYLGRIDTQVKIRGLRIELGEIESVMSGFPGIGLCAVADKRDEAGRQYLVGYYTLADGKEAQGGENGILQNGNDSGTGTGQQIGLDNAGEKTGGAVREIDEKALRQHLSAKLPRYMIPNYFLRLDAMPMTPSGKTDRKNLPVPDFRVQEESIAPETEREKILCHLAEELLGMERVGVEDDFFECGGDSLLAIEYVAKAHDAGIDFPLQSVFDYPTVRSLCTYLDGGKTAGVRYEASEFGRYQEILARSVIEDDFTPVKRSPGNVLLTGATGFLGAHVLDSLMREGADDGAAAAPKIYCLVRSGNTDDRRGRLREILRFYFGDRYENEIGHRILPVVGDIEDEDLAGRLLGKSGNIRTVIHTAASVKHFGSYEYFRRVNCEGTRHVAEYAKAVGARLIHISTLSVSGNDMAEDFHVYRSGEERQFDETCFYIGQPLDNVYIRSKFEAERAVYDAVLSGLDAKVVRVGNLTNRVSDFRFQPNYRENAFLTRVKALLEFGMFPDYLMPLYAEFSPIDRTAEGIVRIAEYADRQCVFHLYNSRHLYYDRFLEIAGQLGIPMKVVDGDVFCAALRQTMKKPETEYIYEAFQNDMDETGKLVYDSNIRIRGGFTEWFLRKVGFEWNEVDLEYIRGYVEYFRRLGYLKV